ncbi:AAA family ATPase [Rheinheimera sp.]|uniref:AAA family ATPase n=1 Tax=Rheinheimera sp. TaxID=1869214 RepID=UPI002FDC8987
MKRRALGIQPEKGIKSVLSRSGYLDLLAGSFVVVGINGSGKTKFFKNFAEDSKSTEFFGNLIESLPNSDFIYYSPSDRVVRNKDLCNTYFKTEDSLEELESYPSIVFSEEHLVRINNVLGAKFESVVLYNIEDFAPGVSAEYIEPFIFVKVQSDGVERNINQLSHGELYLIDLFWQIFYFSNEHVFLLDEPETYLYPKAQQRLISCIFSMNNFLKRQIIFATHSDVVVSELYHFPIVYMTREDSNKFLLSNAKECHPQIMSLGLISAKKALFVCEDVKAIMFFELIIKRNKTISPDSFFYISSKNGESDLRKIGSSIKRSTYNNLYLCFDADQEGLIEPACLDISVILPGTNKLAPEKTLIHAIFNDMSKFLSFFEIKFHQVLTDFIVREVDTNHHDFFKEFSDRTMIPQKTLWEASFDTWFSQNENKDICSAFESNIVKLLGDVI